MLLILSPAKKQDFTPQISPVPASSILCKEETNELVELLQEKSAAQLAKLMTLSSSLAKLNHQRYQDYDIRYYTDANSKPAIFAFHGDVYVGLQAETFNEADLKFAQNHLAILSGLYGVLRPLDLIQAHRLEMGTKLENSEGKDLYTFWQHRLTVTLNHLLTSSGSKTLINLASQEYFKAVDTKALEGEIITIDFKQKQGSSYKTVGIFAKKARGMMANYAITKRITQPAELKKFKVDGYQFNKELSTADNWVFTRTK